MRQLFLPVALALVGSTLVVETTATPSRPIDVGFAMTLVSGFGLAAPLFAQQSSVAEITKKADEPNKAPSSSPSGATNCAALLQHPLAWWLGSVPTSTERDQLAACLAGSGQPSPASPSVSAAVAPSPESASLNSSANVEGFTPEQVRAALGSPSLIDDDARWITWYYNTPKGTLTVPFAFGKATLPRLSPGATGPSASSSNKPARWNTMTADELATWHRLAPKTWNQMTEQEHSDWARILGGPVGKVSQSAPAIPPPQTPVVPAVSNGSAYQRYLTTKLRFMADSGTQAVRHFDQTEWETFCAGHRNDRGTCQGWAPGAVGIGQSVLNAHWSLEMCETERGMSQ